MILNQWRRRKAPLGRAVSTRIAGYVSRSSSTVSASLLTHLYAQPRFAASLSSEGLRSGSAMLPLLRSTLAAATLLLGVALVTGCSSEDPRLVADAKTCQNMGHVNGTAEFKQCMNELNQRRCPTRRVSKFGGRIHEATIECTMLGQ